MGYTKSLRIIIKKTSSSIEKHIKKCYTLNGDIYGREKYCGKKEEVSIIR